MKIGIIGAKAVALLMSVLSSSVTANVNQMGEVVATLPKGSFLENIVTDGNGRLFVTDYTGRAIYRYREDDGLRLIHEVDEYPTGIELTPDGLIVAVHQVSLLSGVQPTEPNSILELSFEGNVEDRFDVPGSIFLNGIEALGDGRYLVADSARGLIHDVTPSTNTVGTWLSHPLLTSKATTGGAPAVNGLKIRNGELWISNSQRRLLMSFPVINPEPEELEIKAANIVIADFVFDDDGTLYATSHSDTLLRIAAVMVTLFFGLFRTGDISIVVGKAIYEISTGCWRIVSRIVSAYRRRSLRSAVSPS